MISLHFIMRMAILLVILFIVDVYAFQAVRTVFKNSTAARWIFWVFSAGVYVAVLYAFIKFDRGSGMRPAFMYIMALMLLSVIPKMLMVAFLFGEDIYRLFVALYTKIKGEDTGFVEGRRKFVSQAALVAAAIPFAGILHGVFQGRYNFRVIRKTLVFEDLPEEFDGFSLTQISDIHAGSFDSADKIRYAVDLINEQKSDVILFTGDLVNNRADEMDPWTSIFAQLKAPMGKFSVLGNHDYGDYVDWNSTAAKRRNMEKLYDVQERMGFRLLRNEHVEISKGNSSISLIGSENWGRGGFAKHGDLQKAAAGVPNDAFKILMSHDPSHFDAVVKDFNKFIHLTLSGHTHGMQFGIEIPGFIKWSPVKYRYPKWAGLYEEKGRKLYVNRGFGFLAFPGRVGIWPEITVLTLRKS